MTYSIVARDPESGAFGVAVQSHYFGTGAVVPWVEAGVGAVATQSFGEISYGILGLERMRAGESASATLAALVAADSGEARRQVGMVDREGRAVAHTGAGCVAHAGHRTGPGWAVQANMMLAPTVPDAMAEAFGGRGDFLERLLNALDAAQAEGGDIRGQQAAALLVAWTAPAGSADSDTILRLHVEDHDQPLVELRRLVTLHRAYQELTDAEDAAQRGDFDAVIPAIERAYALAPANTEIGFWHAGLLTMFGDPRGRPELDAFLTARPDWRELIRRLVTAGIVPDSPEIAELTKAANSPNS
jgi:uncharacterized Ntn-hydrolase superfamily protein